MEGDLVSGNRDAGLESSDSLSSDKSWGKGTLECEGDSSSSKSNEDCDCDREDSARCGRSASCGLVDTEGVRCEPIRWLTIDDLRELVETLPLEVGLGVWIIEDRRGADLGGLIEGVLVVTGVEAIEEALDEGLLLRLGRVVELDCLLEGVDDGTERFWLNCEFWTVYAQ